jgi:hypothetical protein
LARVTAEDSGTLPIHSPASVGKVFAKHDHIKAIAVNAHMRKSRGCALNTMQPHTKAVRVWKVAFETMEALESFVKEVNGSIVDGTRVCVVQEESGSKLWMTKHPVPEEEAHPKSPATNDPVIDNL